MSSGFYEDLKEWIDEKEVYEFDPMHYCIVAMGHSCCYTLPCASWHLDDRDSDGLIAFIGTLEVIKAAALKMLVERNQKEVES